MNSKHMTDDNTNIDDVPAPQTIPSEFVHLIHQFTDDLCATFPEYGFAISEWWGESPEQQQTEMLWEHCCETYVPHFADIMQENNAIFSTDNNEPIMFLPNIDFRTIWNDDTVSDTTKTTIWRYLQCIVLQVVHNRGLGDVEGELKSMFDGMSENMEEMASKFQDMAEKMKEMFHTSSAQATETETDQPEPTLQSESATADAESTVPEFLRNFQSHIERMMEGKIGKIAKDLAEEVAQELGIDPDATTEEADKAGLMDMFQKIMKNPAKMMDIMKKCSQVIKTKIQSGEITEDELREELSGLLGSVQQSQGEGEGGGTNPMEEIKKMFSAMGLDIESLMKMMMGQGMPKGMGGGKGMRMDTSKINRMMQQATTRDRMRSKLEEKQRQKEEEKERAAAAQAERELNYKPLTDEEIAFLSTGVNRNSNNNNNSKNNKKGKKK